MARFRIGQKLLLLSISISVIPLFVASIFIVHFGETLLQKDAANAQILAAQKAANEVDNFLGNKVNVLIFQSQTSEVRQLQVAGASLNLAATIKQDNDMEKITLVNKSGMELVGLNTNGVLPEHKDLSQDDAFKAATFLSGKEYIGPVTYDSNGKPHIVIAVPLIRFTAQQDLTHLSTADFGQYRTPDDIQGVLIASYKLDNLWQSVLSTTVGGSGYAYVVDSKGDLIAHPDPNFLAHHQNVSQVHEVQDFQHNEHDLHQSLSETGVMGISSFEPITRTNWAVIVEEPVSSVYAATMTFTRFAAVSLGFITILLVITSLLFKRQLLRPIRSLSAGAHKIGAGQFDYNIPVKSHDELGDLAKTFNSMGQDLKSLVHDLQIKNVTLATEQGKLANIIQSVSDGVVAVNSESQIVTINSQAVKLASTIYPDYAGKTLSEVFKWTKDNKPFSPDLSKEGTYIYHELILDKGDHFAYLDMSVAVIMPHDSDLTAIITLHDLTPSRELEMMKLDFVAIAAHELRTPLTVVRGYLNLINSDAIKQMSILNIENLQRALIGADQLNNLINNLLNVSHIERGDLHIVKTKLDINKLTKQIVAQQHVTAKLKAQKLDYNAPAHPVYIYADVSAMSEVVNNLLSNAMKYTQANGNITVTLSDEDHQMKLAVNDNGPGIPETAQKRLFTKFYRVERTLTSGNRGTGLGLFISKTIIELHHGTIGLMSKVGQGSSFYFLLPLYNEKLVNQDKDNKGELVGDHGWITQHTDS